MAALFTAKDPQNIHWLIVFDNYDNPRMAGNADPAAVNIRRFLPKADHGTLVMTTRSSRVEIGHPVRLRKLNDLGERVKILLGPTECDSVVHGEIFGTRGNG